MALTRVKYIIEGSTLILIVGLIIFVTNLSSSSCDLQSTEPNIDPTEIKPIKSDSYDALVKFAGYLNFRYEPRVNETYLPLNVDALSLVNSSVIPDTRNLIISSENDCIRLEIQLTTDSQNLTTIDNILVVFVRKIVDFQYCSIEPGQLVVARNSQHYKCEKSIIYLCNKVSMDSEGEHNNTPSTIYLVVVNLELEIDGNKTKVEEKEFSTDSFDCTV